jgi:hypothetical protein
MRDDYQESTVRATIALIAFLLSGLLGYVAYALYQSTQRQPSGIPSEYTEHLFVMGGIAFQPPFVIGAVGMSAAAFFALAIYLLIAARDSPSR